MKSTISTDNKLQEILNFDICKKLVDDAVKANRTDKYVILCPHYSINIVSKFADCEDLQWDLDELSDYIGYMVEVNDYDDLVVDISTDDDEPKGKTFTYYINLDERGSFYADVRDEDEKTVFEIKAGNELGEDETSIFEDGFMKHSTDLDGLKDYLIDLEIMDEDDDLVVSC